MNLNNPLSLVSLKVAGIGAELTLEKTSNSARSIVLDAELVFWSWSKAWVL